MKLVNIARRRIAGACGRVQFGFHRSALQPPMLGLEALEARTLLSGSPLVQLQILGSTSSDGPFSDTVDTAPGQTVYYEVIGQLAPVGTSNGAKTITSLTAHPTPGAIGYDGISGVSFNLTESGDFNGNFAAASLAVNPDTGDNWNGSFSSAGSGGLDQLSGVWAFQALGVRAAALAPETILTGSLVVDSAAPADGTASVAGTWEDGGIVINSDPATGASSPADRFIISVGDPNGDVSFAPLTIITGNGGSQQPGTQSPSPLQFGSPTGDQLGNEQVDQFNVKVLATASSSCGGSGGGGSPPPSYSLQVSNFTLTTATEGSAATLSGNITDNDPCATTFTLAIDWGDGSQPDQILGNFTAGNAGFSDSHTYAQAGYYKVSASAVDNDSNGNQESAEMPVLDAPLVSTGDDIQATVAFPSGSINVATFMDVDPSATASLYTAQIDWGDNSTSSGTIVADGNGWFDVTGNHTYSSVGNCSSAVTISDIGGSTTTATGNVSVVGPALYVSGLDFNATKGQPYTDVVANFTDTNPDAIPGNYQAIILWGDGQTSAGSIAADGNGGYNVTGTNTYATSGSFAATITVTDNAAESGNATANASVSPVSIQGGYFNATEGQDFSAVVATFSDSDPNTCASSYAATVNWQDGNTTSGTILPDGNGGFIVSGNHTYAEAGTYYPLVTVTETGAAGSASASAQGYISDASLSLTGQDIAAVQGQLWTGIVGSFTDANPLSSAADFVASINWQDGDTSTGFITAVSGNFVITGSETFASVGSYQPTITITDIGGTTVSGNATATVTSSFPSNQPTALPNAVTNVQAQVSTDPLHASGNQVLLTWDSDGQNVDGFNIYRTKSPTDASIVLIKWVGSGQKSYLDQGPLPGNYTYQVKAENTLGNSTAAQTTAGVWPAGYLVAFDGTWEGQGNNTVIKQFVDNYHAPDPNKKYYPGVGADNNGAQDLVNGALALDAMNNIGAALTALTNFYNQVPSPLKTTPLDIVGLSRGAYQAVKLANILTNQGIPDLHGATDSYITTQWLPGRIEVVTRHTVYEHYFKANVDFQIRLVGLVSPVGMMGLGTPISVFSLGLLDINPLWNRSLPDGVLNAVQVLDGNPDDLIYPQTTMNLGNANAATRILSNVNHQDIGWDPRAEGFLSVKANDDDVPVNPYGNTTL